MRISLSLAFVAITACTGAAFLVACTGDDTNGSNPTADSGSGDGAPLGDATPGDGGGDGGCNFAVFVTGLIQNHTNGTDQPSTDLGQGCVDNQNQAEFKPLFP